MNLLSKGNTNAKTSKNERPSFIMYMSPSTANDYGVNVCPHASKGCSADCLAFQGRGRFSNVQQSRVNKTNLWAKDRKGFYIQLGKELTDINRKAKEITLVRLNGTSDVDHLALLKIYTRIDWMTFENILFYDYTKVPSRLDKYRDTQYHLTFSYSGENVEGCKKALGMGYNVAAVFRHELPNEWLGYNVINGDESDERPNDPRPCVVGLKAKGSAKKSIYSFIID
jgi:hypothetical protein